METWREAIANFDANLRARMIVITQHEVTGVDFASQLFFRRALGFPSRRQFPSWRDHTKEWRNRNRERVNIVGREQQRNWRLKNNDRARERERKYYKDNREKILETKRICRKKFLTKVLELVS
jgi:hypothetical protein